MSSSVSRSTGHTSAMAGLIAPVRGLPAGLPSGLRSRAALAAGALAVVAAVVAPGLALAGSDLALGRADSGRHVTVVRDTTIRIVLPSNASTGYTWVVSTEPGSILEAGPDSGAYTPPTSDLIGAPGLQAFTYVAIATGSTWFELRYVSPGTDRVVGDSFELYVVVTANGAPSPGGPLPETNAVAAPASPDGGDPGLWLAFVGSSVALIAIAAWTVDRRKSVAVDE